MGENPGIGRLIWPFLSKNDLILQGFLNQPLSCQVEGKAKEWFFTLLHCLHHFILNKMVDGP